MRAKAKEQKLASRASSSSEASSSRSASPVANHGDNRDSASSSVSGSDGGVDVESDEEANSDEEESIRQPNIDAEKARTKLHHVAKTLRATAKKTKTFEVQKLVKKLKGLKKKPSLADQAKLAEAELEAIKSIDINLLAGRALVTKMVKAKLLPRPAELDAATDSSYFFLPLLKAEALLGEVVLSDPVDADGDRALERAKAKITSSKVLADEVGRFVDELKKLAGIDPIPSKTKDQMLISRARARRSSWTRTKRTMNAASGRGRMAIRTRTRSLCVRPPKTRTWKTMMRTKRSSCALESRSSRRWATFRSGMT